MRLLLVALVLAGGTAAGAQEVIDAAGGSTTGQAANTVLRVKLGRDGAVKSCAVLQSSGDPALDAKACPIVTARFTPEPLPKNEPGKIYVRPPYAGVREFDQVVRWQLVD